MVSRSVVHLLLVSLTVMGSIASCEVEMLWVCICIRRYISHSHLIPDELLSIASAILIADLKYHYTASDPGLLEHTCVSGPSGPHPYPTSIRLEYDHGINQDRRQHPVPGFVLLTKMSDFHLNKMSSTISLPRPHLNRMLRYPTLTTYLDSLVATILDPRHGHHEFICRWAKANRNARMCVLLSMMEVIHEISLYIVPLVP